MMIRVPVRLLGEENTFDVRMIAGLRQLTELLPGARGLTDQAEQLFAQIQREKGQPIRCEFCCTACSKSWFDRADG